MYDLWVDFNDLDRRGNTMTLLEFAAPGAHVTLGSHLTVGDGEGNECRAVVTGMRNQSGQQTVYLSLDLGTFVSSEQRAALYA